MIRVLFVNTRSAIGADVAVHISLIQNLDPVRCAVHVATNSRASDAEEMQRILRAVPGVRFVALNLGYELAGRSKAAKLLGAAGNAGALCVGLIRLTWLVRRWRIDVIHSTDRPRDALVSTLLAKLTGRRNVIHAHIKWHEWLGRATNWALRRCTAVLAISQFVRRSFIEGGVPAEKIYVALNASDPERYDPGKTARGKFRSALGLGANVPLVGIIARIMLWKGHLELVEAMAQVRNVVPGAHLVVIGEEDRLTSPDDYAGRVRKRIEELDLTNAVTWAGWFDDMPAVYADLDVVCVPSWEEPFGLVVTEAMAMQRPVIGFESGAIPEILADGQEGLLVQPKNTDHLAQALITLLQDAALRREMGHKGRQTVIKRFTPRRQADEVVCIYERLYRGDKIPTCNAFY